MAFYIEREGKYLHIWDAGGGRMGFHWFDCSVEATPFETMEEARKGADEYGKGCPGLSSIREVPNYYAECYAGGEMMAYWPHLGGAAFMSGAEFAREYTKDPSLTWCDNPEVPPEAAEAAAQSYWKEHQTEVEMTLSKLPEAAIKNLFLAGVSFAEMESVSSDAAVDC